MVYPRSMGLVFNPYKMSSQSVICSIAKKKRSSHHVWLAIEYMNNYRKYYTEYPTCNVHKFCNQKFSVREGIGVALYTYSFEEWVKFFYTEPSKIHPRFWSYDLVSNYPLDIPQIYSCMGVFPEFINPIILDYNMNPTNIHLFNAMFRNLTVSPLPYKPRSNGTSEVSVQLESRASSLSYKFVLRKIAMIKLTILRVDDPVILNGHKLSAIYLSGIVRGSTLNIHTVISQGVPLHPMVYVCDNDFFYLQEGGNIDMIFCNQPFYRTYTNWHSSVVPEIVVCDVLSSLSAYQMDSVYAPIRDYMISGSERFDDPELSGDVYDSVWTDDHGTVDLQEAVRAIESNLIPRRLPLKDYRWDGITDKVIERGVETIPVDFIQDRTSELGVDFY